MKALLLASALAFGGTAIAQDTTTTTTPPPAQEAPPAPGTTPPPPPTAPDAAPAPGDAPAAPMTPPGTPVPPPPPGAPTPPAPGMAPPPPPPAPMGAAPTTGTGEMTKGGYMPSTPPLAQQPVPGQQVVVQPSRSPNEAFPPPAPKESYPICKKGQTDGCRQRGG